ncbi:MAG: hypothetical protein F6K29_34725, partial [Okeania sp. SIO2G5]|nr:hypothetical protein [Okeania sp. SIO2G5]
MMWVGIIGLVIIGSPILIGGLLFLFQRRLLYPGTHLRLSTLSEPLPPHIEKIDYAEGGYGLFLNTAIHDHDARPVLLYVHGNAET